MDSVLTGQRIRDGVCPLIFLWSGSGSPLELRVESVHVIMLSRVFMIDDG